MLNSDFLSLVQLNIISGNHHTASTGTTSTLTMQLSHSNNSNNNNMNSSNLNLTTATHNGFGINHSMINNQTQSTNHFNSTQSTLTYRSNRRSMDRSDNNKIGETISTSSSSSSAASASASSSAAATQMRNAALQYNDPIHEYDLTHSRSYFNMCLYIIYKMLMFIYCGFGKRRPTSLNNATNARMPESMFSRFLCALNSRAIGNGANGFVGNGNSNSNSNSGSGNIISGDSASNYIRNVSNDNGNEQIGYIERIDDENVENHSDLHVNTKLAASFASHAPITIELPNAGKCIYHLFTAEKFTFKNG